MAFVIRDRRTGLHYAGMLKRVSATVWRRRARDARLFDTALEAHAELAGLGPKVPGTAEVVDVRVRSVGLDARNPRRRPLPNR